MTASPRSHAAVQALADEGVPKREIARRTGYGISQVYRILYPDYAEKCRALSREAKRRRTGTCVDCGTVTRYNGTHPFKGVSDLCQSCASSRSAALAGDGPATDLLLRMLKAGPVRFVVLRDALESAGFSPLSIHPILYGRLIPSGRVRRISRGVYRAAR